MLTSRIKHKSKLLFINFISGALDMIVHHNHHFDFLHYRSIYLFYPRRPRLSF
jgi:hypothetical protein